MSTWTSREAELVGVLRLNKLGFALATLVLVAGCDAKHAPTRDRENQGKLGIFSRFQADPLKSGKVLRRAPIAGGDVIVAGPSGYCIDGRSLTDKATGGFALLASCDGLSDGQIGGFVDPAIMTVTVLPRQIRAEQPDAATLAKSGAEILQRIDGDGLSLVHLATGGKAVSNSSDPKYWRGAMVINGHVVGLALYAPKGSELAGSEGLKLAMALAEQLRTGSPYKEYALENAITAQATPGDPSGPADIEAEDPPNPRKNRFKKLFPRLFQ